MMASVQQSACFAINLLTAAMSTTPRRGRAMPTDGPTAKFLYTIIKQLDLKSVSEVRPALP